MIAGVSSVVVTPSRASRFVGSAGRGGRVILHDVPSPARLRHLFAEMPVRGTARFRSAALSSTNGTFSSLQGNCFAGLRHLPSLAVAGCFIGCQACRVAGSLYTIRGCRMHAGICSSRALLRTFRESRCYLPYVGGV